MDVRPGGVYRLLMGSAEGQEVWWHWVFREIVEPERLVWTCSIDRTDDRRVSGGSGDALAGLLLGFFGKAARGFFQTESNGKSRILVNKTLTGPSVSQFLASKSIRETAYSGDSHGVQGAVGRSNRTRPESGTLVINCDRWRPGSDKTHSAAREPESAIDAGFQDLHWIDVETQTFLNMLVGGIASVPVLLLGRTAVETKPRTLHQNAMSGARFWLWGHLGADQDARTALLGR
jgi:uncharacterized protein YndB with AHSA1/START domain